MMSHGEEAVENDDSSITDNFKASNAKGQRFERRGY